MSVLKDLLHGITPAERKRIEAEKEQEHQKWLGECREKRIAEEQQIRDSINSSPITKKITADLADLVSREYWQYGKDCFGKPYQLSAKDALSGTYILINETGVEVSTTGRNNFNVSVYAFNFNSNGYANLTDRLKREYFIEAIANKLKTVLSDNYYLEYRSYTEGGYGTIWKQSAPDRPNCNCIYIHQKEPASTPVSLKSW